MKPPLAPMDIAKVAVGKEHLPDQSFNDWETILSEIITHDVFGADRMDYLLRDSYHAGVAYGDFDHYRLIDTLRILPPPPTPPPGATDQLEIEELTATEDRGSVEPTLGVEQGGLRTAEALLLARFFMYSEVYCHQVRRVYDEHLVEFLEQWLDGGMFSVDLDDHLTMTDSNVVSAIWRTSQDPDMDGHLPAKRIVERGHLKVVDEVSPNVSEENPGAIETLEGELADEFGEEMIWADDYVSDPDEIDFPVFNHRTENVSSALSLSQPLQHMPPVRTDRVYADDSIRDEVEDWLEEHRSQILEV